MDLSFSGEDEAFRAEVRAFLEDVGPRLPKDLGPAEEATRSRDEYMAWHKLLFAKGWVAPAWPRQYGGAGWSLTQRYIFNEEAARADMPATLAFGLTMVGPVIYTYGSQAQKEFFLPRILSGEDWWCQGYSEPGAGSDLASLRLKAVRDGNDYVVTGQKTWTTLAQYADWIFCLVRTDATAKKQEGISFLLIDMKALGITVKPIIVLDGAREVNEVFFDGVRVPVANRVGEENKGWTYAKFLLAHERSSLAGVARSKAALRKLKAMARAEGLLEAPDFAHRLAALEADLMVLEITELRALTDEAAGKPSRGEASVLKIAGTELQQRMTQLAMEAAGYYALPYERGFSGNVMVGPHHALGIAGRYFNARKTSIYGGSNEIQRNIIAKTVLGL